MYYRRRMETLTSDLTNPGIRCAPSGATGSEATSQTRSRLTPQGWPVCVFAKGAKCFLVLPTLPHVRQAFVFPLTIAYDSAMPTIRGISGPYRLFFFSLDCNEPRHVHVATRAQRVQVLNRTGRAGKQSRLFAGGTQCDSSHAERQTHADFGGIA